MARKARQVIEYRLYELPLAFPILLLDGDIWHISDVRSDRLHFHNCLEIGICHSDGGTIILRDEPVSFRAGDITVIPRHMPHTTFSGKGTQSLWSYIFVNLADLLSDMTALPDDLNKPGEGFPYLLSRTEHPKIHFLVTCILEELRGEKRSYRIAVKGLFIALYYEILRMCEENALQPHRAAPPKKDTLALTPALEHINENYDDKLTIGQLSGMCHLSATHFRRLFLSIMGTSPLAFINATRIDRACVLLKTTVLPILEIAGEVGFASLPSFNRAFTAVMKQSPRAYRNADIGDSLKPQRKYVLKYAGWMAPDKLTE
jgi:AraC-like DNA-binding protein